jgi:hypothetical protein
VAQRKTARKTSSKRGTSRPSNKAGASRKTKSGASKAARSSASKRAGEQEVTVDRRRNQRRREEKAASAGKSPAPPQKLERRKKVNRRRQIDPTTCERDYTNDEIEFMNALDEYKRKSGRMFPTCSEVLEVVRTLGYVKRSAADQVAGQCASTSMAAGSASPTWCADTAECPAVNGDESEVALQVASAD